VGRTWDEAEPDLRRGWDSYEHRGKSPAPWEEIKDAVGDAWERVMDRTHQEAGGTPGR
jgi:hypothetical protein